MSRDTRSIDQTKVATFTMKTTGIEVTPSSSAAAAGPTKNDSDSIVLAVPLAAVSSSGRSARLGRIARWATRNGVPISEAAVARMKIGQAGVSRARHSAARLMSTARITSVAIITRLRGSLSTSPARKGAERAPRAKRMDTQMPTVFAPPSPKAQTATAVA